MYHPIRKIRETIEAVQLTILNFQKLLLALRLAVENNTAATAALLETSKATLDAAQASQTSTAYLASAERHSREQAGQRHEF